MSSENLRSSLDRKESHRSKVFFPLAWRLGVYTNTSKVATQKLICNCNSASPKPYGMKHRVNLFGRWKFDFRGRKSRRYFENYDSEGR